MTRMTSEKPLSRRTFTLGTIAGTAAGVVAASTPRASATPVTPPPPVFAKGRPILFRGATVVSMDARLGVLPAADVLVLGNEISAVGPGLEAPPAPRSSTPPEESCSQG